MSLDDLLQHDVVIHAYSVAAVDAEGNVTESYTPDIGASSPITKAFVQPGGGGSELDQAGQKIASKPWKMYLHAGTSIKTSDRVTWQGRVFDVVSDFSNWRPTEEHHIKVELHQSGWVNAS